MAKRLAKPCRNFTTHTLIWVFPIPDELPGVVQRAADAGITRIVTCHRPREQRRAIDLAKRSTVCSLRSAGIQRRMAAPDDVRAELERLAKQPKVVAIGEIGIDHYWLPSTRGGTEAEDEAFKARQVQLFRQQLEVAAELGLSVVIHQRVAFEPCMDVFEPFKLTGCVGCSTVLWTIRRRPGVLALGSIVSFTGVSIQNAAEVRESMASVPLDKLMLETDAPFLAPVPYRANAANRRTCARSARWLQRRCDAGGVVRGNLRHGEGVF